MSRQRLDPAPGTQRLAPSSQMLPPAMDIPDRLEEKDTGAIGTADPLLLSGYFGAFILCKGQLRWQSSPESQLG